MNQLAGVYLGLFIVAELKGQHESPVHQSAGTCMLVTLNTLIKVIFKFRPPFPKLVSLLPSMPHDYFGASVRILSGADHRAA